MTPKSFGNAQAWIVFSLSAFVLVAFLIGGFQQISEFWSVFVTKDKNLLWGTASEFEIIRAQKVNYNGKTYLMQLVTREGSKLALAGEMPRARFLLRRATPLEDSMQFWMGERVPVYEIIEPTLGHYAWNFLVLLTIILLTGFMCFGVIFALVRPASD